MATISTCADKPSRNNENIKYILVTGGVMSGVGKGVIASSLATLLQLCGIEVTSIKIDPYINVDCGTMSPFEHEVVLKAKWKGLRDNFRVEYKRIPRLDNGEFRIDPATFESKWIHYYALLFLREVYVLDDGSEVDLDLGNYERFLDVNLHADNSITTGKIYQLVIQKERHGDYLGKTVQVVPHLTNAIEEWVERVAQKPVRDNKKPQVCIIELGGTTGDIEGMPFVEAFRTFQNRKKSENFCLAHVSPVSFWAGEHKTKPTQGSVRVLRSHDLKPDLIFCRSAEEKKEGNSLIIEAKEKISHFCNVPLEQIIWVHDVSSIYRVPLLLEEHGVIEFLNERFQLNIKPNIRERCLQKWKQLACRSEMLRKEVSIALVGKYTKLKDSYASVIKALEHASLQVGYKLKLNFIDSSLLESETLKTSPSEYHKEWQLLCESDGVVVPGGFGARGMEGKINACEWCRKNRKPFLGICLGLQAAVIEFARNVLGLDEANTTEIDKNTKDPLIIDMEGHCGGEYGGTMRLGKQTTTFNKDVNSILKQLYGNVDTIEERHRHRYEVNEKYKSQIDARGLRFVATGDNGKRMEIIELDGHPYYVGTQFHPEFLSRPMKPSPPFLGLILASVKSLDKYIAGGCRFSPWQISDTSSDDDDDNQYLMSAKMNSLKVNGHSVKHYKHTNGATSNGEANPREKFSVDNTAYNGNGFIA